MKILKLFLFCLIILFKSLNFAAHASTEQYDSGPVELVPQDNGEGEIIAPQRLPTDPHAPVDQQMQSDFHYQEHALPQPHKVSPAIKPIPIQPSPLFGTSEPMASGNARHTLEEMAACCEKEVIELWQRRAQVPPQNLKHFQIAIGNAQEQCRALKKEVEALKRADANLNSYQQELQKARQFSEG